MICCMCDLHVVRSFDIFPEISTFETSRVVSQWKVLVASNKYLFLLCFNFLLFDKPQLRIMRTLRVQNSLSLSKPTFSVRWKNDAQVGSSQYE